MNINSNTQIDQKKVSETEIDELLEKTLKTSKNDIDYYEKAKKDLAEYFKPISEIVSVLGIDIYQYSHFELTKQNLIPIIFKKLYEKTLLDLATHESLFFENISPEFLRDHFLETGDGGFQILPNPLLSLLFVIYFHSNLRAYNSGSQFSNFYKYVGNLELRYCITLNEVFGYNKNFFGPAIIENARIISSDSLNRFLIEDNTYKWFIKYFGGIETLVILNPEDVVKILELDNKNKENTLIFDSTDVTTSINCLQNIHILKLEPISKKGKTFPVYSLSIQLNLNLSKDKVITKKFIISIGNLNSLGI